MHKFSCTKTSSSGEGQDPSTQQRLSLEVEKEAATFIDKYGSYLDIYKCLIFAGKLHSKILVDKLVDVAKYDSRHKEAVKSLKKAKVLLFYEPVSQSSFLSALSNATLSTHTILYINNQNMLSALLELLPTTGTNREEASGFDYTSLLVSSYPDLQPWCIQEASDPDGSDDFYLKYLSSLLHHEDGNDSAKQDGDLVRVSVVYLVYSLTCTIQLTFYMCHRNTARYSVLLMMPNHLILKRHAARVSSTLHRKITKVAVCITGTYFSSWIAV